MFIKLMCFLYCKNFLQLVINSNTLHNNINNLAINEINNIMNNHKTNNYKTAGYDHRFINNTSNSHNSSNKT
jgi:hypothetical protein